MSKSKFIVYYEDRYDSWCSRHDTREAAFKAYNEASISIGSQPLGTVTIAEIIDEVSAAEQRVRESVDQ